MDDWLMQRVESQPSRNMQTKHKEHIKSIRFSLSLISKKEKIKQQTSRAPMRSIAYGAFEMRAQQKWGWKIHWNRKKKNKNKQQKQKKKRMNKTQTYNLKPKCMDSEFNTIFTINGIGFAGFFLFSLSHSRSLSLCFSHFGFVLVQ